MAVTGWSGLYENEHGAEYALLVGTLTGIKSPITGRISKMLRKGRSGLRGLNAVMKALNGAAASGPASATYSRISASKESDDDFGGVRTIETRTVLSRNTTAADETFIDDLLDRDSQPASYVADASGNGGGGKLGF